MINLLPLKNKISIKKEYLGRLVLFFCLFSFLVILLATIFLSLFGFLIKDQQKNYSNYMDLINKRFLSMNEKEIFASVNDINTKTEIVEKYINLDGKTSEIIKKIINIKTEKIKINYIAFTKSQKKEENDKIKISGFSNTRKELIDFTENLKKDSSFAKVYSPVSNFLNDENVEFTIDIEIYEKK